MPTLTKKEVAEMQPHNQIPELGSGKKKGSKGKSKKKSTKSSKNGPAVYLGAPEDLPPEPIQEINIEPGVRKETDDIASKMRSIEDRLKRL